VVRRTPVAKRCGPVWPMRPSILDLASFGPASALVTLAPECLSEKNLHCLREL